VAEICIHNIPKMYCGLCNGDEQFQRSVKKVRRIHTRNKKNKKEQTLNDISVIHSAAEGNVDYSGLNAYTRRIHINGYPFRHILNEIATRCPILEVIQMPKKMIARLSNDSIEFCNSRNIFLEPGLIRSENSRISIPSKDFLAQQEFMVKLSDTPKALFDELISLSFTEAQMTARYFCLNGEDRCSLAEVSQQFGFNPDNRRLASTYISAVLSYLGFNIVLKQAAVRKLKSIQSRVLISRESKN
jgi:hypothetical protein